MNHCFLKNHFWIIWPVSILLSSRESISLALSPRSSWHNSQLTPFSLCCIHVIKAGMIFTSVFSLDSDMTTFKSIRIANAWSYLAETWHTCSWCPCAPACQVAHLLSSAFGSHQHPIGKNANLPSSSGIIDFGPLTSIDDISASTRRSEPFFGDVFRIVLFSVRLKFRVNRSNRSPAIEQGFAPYCHSKTG